MIYVECILVLFSRFIIYREAALSIYHCLVRVEATPRWLDILIFLVRFQLSPTKSHRPVVLTESLKSEGVTLPINSSQRDGWRRTFQQQRAKEWDFVSPLILLGPGELCQMSATHSSRHLFSGHESLFLRSAVVLWMPPLGSQGWFLPGCFSSGPNLMTSVTAGGNEVELGVRSRSQNGAQVLPDTWATLSPQAGPHSLPTSGFTVPGFLEAKRSLLRAGLCRQAVSLICVFLMSGPWQKRKKQEKRLCPTVHATLFLCLRAWPDGDDLLSASSPFCVPQTSFHLHSALLHLRFCDALVRFQPHVILYYNPLILRSEGYLQDFMPIPLGDPQGQYPAEPVLSDRKG